MPKKPTAKQELVLGAMKNGKPLYSTRLQESRNSFGNAWASISTINSLLQKGLIVAEPELNDGPFYTTIYKVQAS